RGNASRERCHTRTAERCRLWPAAGTIAATELTSSGADSFLCEYHSDRAGSICGEDARAYGAIRRGHEISQGADNAGNRQSHCLIILNGKWLCRAGRADRLIVE